MHLARPHMTGVSTNAGKYRRARHSTITTTGIPLFPRPDDAEGMRAQTMSFDKVGRSAPSSREAVDYAINVHNVYDAKHSMGNRRASNLHTARACLGWSAHPATDRAVMPPTFASNLMWCRNSRSGERRTIEMTHARTRAHRWRRPLMMMRRCF